MEAGLVQGGLGDGSERDGEGVGSEMEGSSSGQTQTSLFITDI